MVTLLLAIILVSCKTESKSDSEVATSDTTTSNSQSTTSSQSIELEVYDYAGLERFLSTTTDTTYVVNFWATWCAPCVKELPYFEQLDSNYADKKVEVILVSLDFPKKFDSNLIPFIKEKDLKSKVVALNDMDSNMWIPKISEDWSGAIPATLIFNKNRRHFYERTFTYDELETEVKQFIN